MSERVRRVNELMRQILSEALGEMTDPGLGFVTITSVDMHARLRARDGVRVGARQRAQAQALAARRWSARKATCRRGSGAR